MAADNAMSDGLLYFLAIFIPPIPVYIKARGGGELALNILLWIFTWILGIIHAWYIIATHPRPGPPSSTV